MKHAIALLATGNELVQGEILNRDAQYFAQCLTDRGITIVNHLIVTDDINAIIKALGFLFQHVDTVITTGGLGPTSDDRTRDAVAAAMQRPLEFDQANWQAIQAYLGKLGLATHPSNKQQAYFPQQATVFANPHGTAAGCMVQHHDKTLYMLPGPPNECFPMFDRSVLPRLQQSHQPKVKPCLWRWRLFAVSEGAMATQLDQAVQAFEHIMGYRTHYPYLDVKLLIADTEENQLAKACIQKAAAPYVICQADETATSALVYRLETHKKPLYLIDEVTQGLLQSRLVTPRTKNLVQFVSEPPNHKATCLKLTGLDDYWQGKPPQGNTQVTIKRLDDAQPSETTHTLPYRSTRIVELATEYLSYRIHQIIV